ncbi:macro domain-containing protein [bacterium]|nr:macro domain-containing protein [bacterium]
MIVAEWASRVRIELGDIAEADTEAVVNAANNELWMGSGVAGALKRAGGSVIEQEAVRQGPIAVGESVMTNAGDLPALHVIHAAAMAPGRPATEQTVHAATSSALKLAARENISSIALPALGAGVGGLSLMLCAEQMLAATRSHCAEHEQPQEIRFLLFGQNALDVFGEVFSGME